MFPTVSWWWITALILLLSECSAIKVARSDTNFDITLYLNGQPLRAQSTVDLPAFQQVRGVVLPNGQRVPPGPFQNGVNMVIYVARVPALTSAFGTVTSSSVAPSGQNGSQFEVDVKKDEEKNGDVTITISKS